MRTTLFGQESDEQAMHLEDFLDETLTLLHGEPTLKEVIVERAKFLRTAECYWQLRHRLWNDCRMEGS